MPPKATWPSADRQVGPVLGVLLGEVGDDLAVDAVDQHEAAGLGRLLRGVEEDPPGGSAAEPAPAELGRRVAHREPDLAGGGHQRVALVEVEVPPGYEVVGAQQHQQDAGAEEARSEEHTSELQSLMRNSYAA